MGYFLTILFCLWGILCFHSCVPGTSQRDVLSLQRASDDVVKDYTDSFRNSSFFLSTTKNCPHCGRLVEASVSVGECMFREVSNLSPETPGYRQKVLEMYRQLRGEAEQGCGQANHLLGLIKENGLFGMKPDQIAAARYYRLFADTGTPEGRAALGCYWIRIGENIPQAAVLLEKALEEDPRNTEFYMYLARAYSMTGKVLPAFETAKKAYYYSPVNSLERLHIEVFFVSCLLEAAGELGEENTLSQINDLIYISPKNSNLKFARASIYARFGHFDEACKQLDALKDQLPERSLELERIHFDAMKKDYASAQKRLDSLFSQKPRDPELRRVRLQLLLSENKEADAMKTVDSYIAEDENKMDSLLLRAQLLFDKKDYDGTIRDYEAAKEYASPVDCEFLDVAIRKIRAVKEDPLRLDSLPQELTLPPSAVTE